MLEQLFYSSDPPSFASFRKREGRERERGQGQSAFAQIGQGLMASLIWVCLSACVPARARRPRARELDQDVQVISGAPATKVGLFGLLVIIQEVGLGSAGGKKCLIGVCVCIEVLLSKGGKKLRTLYLGAFWSLRPTFLPSIWYLRFGLPIITKSCYTLHYTTLNETQV